MASSSYYKAKRDEWARAADRFSGWVRELKGVQSSFKSNQLLGKRDDANKKIDNCISEMNLGIQGTAFDSQDLSAAKEVEPLNDANINSAYNSLTAEILHIENERDTARENSDYYHRLYLDALKSEAQEC